MKIILITLSLITSLLGECNQFYYKKPVININLKHTELCNRFFVIEYNPSTKTPYYTANVLTTEIVQGSGSIGRKDTFHEDVRLVPKIQSTLKDYKKSGYDRGHLVPSDDMPDFESQNESFSLSNIVPQNPKNNRGVWKKLEDEARDYTRIEKRVYVISGPIYDNYNKTIGNNVIVPTRLFKIIFLPSKNKSIVYVVNNNGNRDLNITNINELEKVVQFKFSNK